MRNHRKIALALAAAVIIQIQMSTPWKTVAQKRIRTPARPTSSACAADRSPTSRRYSPAFWATGRPFASPARRFFFRRRRHAESTLFEADRLVSFWPRTARRDRREHHGAWRGELYVAPPQLGREHDQRDRRDDRSADPSRRLRNHQRPADDFGRGRRLHLVVRPTEIIEHPGIVAVTHELVCARDSHGDARDRIKDGHLHVSPDLSTLNRRGAQTFGAWIMGSFA